MSAMSTGEEKFLHGDVCTGDGVAAVESSSRAGAKSSLVRDVRGGKCGVLAEYLPSLIYRKPGQHVRNGLAGWASHQGRLVSV